METLIFHELRIYNETSTKHRRLAYYAVPSVAEIDFIIETRKARPKTRAHVVCIEVKLSENLEHAMRDLKKRTGLVVE